MNDVPFTGFTPQSLDFFRRLEKNNDREWFAAHREEYKTLVADPMLRLVAELTPMMRQMDSGIVTDPRRAVARIHRDTRFSRDKTPYWPYLWFAFRHNSKTWFHMPTYFFELDGSQYSFGLNIYTPSAATMRRFRGKIDADASAFQNVIRPILRSRTLRLRDDRYKRRIPSAHGQVIDAWYQCRAITVMTYREPDKTLFSKKLIDLLIDRFLVMKPLYDFLWEVTVIP